MSKKNPTICLNMIVKNEAHIIVETLESVKKYIDYWVICDTGSTDNTKELIISYFEKQKIPGKLIEEPWTGHFGYNRTVALKACKGKADYVWVIDADDLICGEIKIPKGRYYDCYNLTYGKEFTYARSQIFNNRLDWRYECVRHEFPVCRRPKYGEYWIKGDYYIDSRRLGDRSKDPKKYLNDALAFIEWLPKEPQHEVRYKFYIGQSYLDYGDIENGIKWYQERIKMGGWIEEVYYSYYRIAQAKSRRRDKWEDIEKAYMDAWKCLPSRVEPLYEIAHYERIENKNHEKAYKYSKLGSRIKFPTDQKLFIHKEYYDWKIWDELAINAFWTERYEESFNINDNLIRRKLVPEDQRDRIKRNRKFSIDKLSENTTKNPSPDETPNQVLVFYVGYASFGNDDVYGSELALVSLAKCLAANYRIIVFGASCKLQIKDGIEYMSIPEFKNFQHHTKIDILVISRYINYFLEFPITAKKTYIWIHDTVLHAAWNGLVLPDHGKSLIINLLDRIDGFVTLTNWHKNLFHSIYGITKGVTIIGNGLNDSYFTDTITKIKGKFIYTSDPTRGLEVLIDYFHEIHKKYPYTQLYVYRGESSFKSCSHLLKLMKDCDYIHYEGKVTQDQLAKEMEKSDIWLYPTDFSETYCMSGLEALRAGCYCICSDLAALKDTIGPRGFLIDGDIRSEDTKNKFLNQVNLALTDDNHRKEVQEKAKEWAKNQTWGHRATEWINMFNVKTKIEDEEWIVVEGYDSGGGDVKHVPNQSVDMMKEICLLDPNCIGFNSNGYFKSVIKSEDSWDVIPGNFSMYILKSRYETVSKIKNVKFDVNNPFNVDTYIINLKRRNDRWIKMISKFENIGIDKYNRVDAVDGKELKMNKEIMNMFRVDENFIPKRAFGHHNYNKAVIGTALSHISIWKELANSEKQNMDYILILEDDINFNFDFSSQWKDISNYVDNNFEWDILFLGFTDYVDIYGDINITPKLKHLIPTKRIHGAGLFSYCIRKKAAIKLLDLIDKYRVQQPIDHFVIDHFDSLYCLKTTEHIIKSPVYGTETTDTDIQNSTDSFITN